MILQVVGDLSSDVGISHGGSKQLQYKNYVFHALPDIGSVVHCCLDPSRLEKRPRSSRDRFGSTAALFRHFNLTAAFAR
jgi:hypothetical protein